MISESVQVRIEIMQELSNLSLEKTALYAINEIIIGKTQLINISEIQELSVCLNQEVTEKCLPICGKSFLPNHVPIEK